MLYKYKKSITLKNTENETLNVSFSCYNNYFIIVNYITFLWFYWLEHQNSNLANTPLFCRVVDLHQPNERRASPSTNHKSSISHQNIQNMNDKYITKNMKTFFLKKYIKLTCLWTWNDHTRVEFV